ncbi:hypothetical protein ACA910_021131 [Epithemia clementina (nom. ined.)]
MAVIAALMFGDASGTGFGTFLWIQGSNHVTAEHGLWTREYGQRSSNFRELFNLVACIGSLVTDGKIIPGTKLFVFTDNSTAEAAFFKGTSTSKLLFELVLQLKCLEMTGSIFVHVIWVAGTRMIAQGTDGLSRGDLMHGVLAGVNMLQYVSLNLTSEERQPGLSDFFISLARDSFTFVSLNAEGWFGRSFEIGNFLWIPPPAADDVTVEKMCESKHIRPESAHIFIAPALMTCRWRKRLGRVADVVFSVPVDTPLWSKAQHKPLIVAFVLPYFRTRPWQFKRDQRAVDEFLNPLREIRKCNSAWHAACYTQHELDEFPVLQAADLDDALMDSEDPGDIVDDPLRFKESRGGDFLMCPFQCDECAFLNIRGRYPDEQRFSKDRLLLLCIRRANLDAFWAQEQSTVQRNKIQMRGLLDAARQLGIDEPLPHRGPFPTNDSFGMGTACVMLMKTLRAGKNAEQIQLKLHARSGQWSRILFTPLRTEWEPRLLGTPNKEVISLVEAQRTATGLSGS